jgi:Domain of unknown function (DUF5642)
VASLPSKRAHPADRGPVPSTNPAIRHVDPDNIRRVRRDLPPGYEVRGVSGVAAPQEIWGIDRTGAANPGRCAALADPGGGHGQSAHGISGSGAGGTVYAVVVAVPSGPVALDQSLLVQCRQWSLTGKRASARIHLVGPPHIDGAETLGMDAEVTTSVEGGNEIGSRASTFTAYLGNYYAFSTLVSDPGSPNPALTQQFAADLLVKTVSALRS